MKYVVHIGVIIFACCMQLGAMERAAAGGCVGSNEPMRRLQIQVPDAHSRVDSRTTTPIHMADRSSGHPGPVTPISARILALTRELYQLLGVCCNNIDKAVERALLLEAALPSPKTPWTPRRRLQELIRLARRWPRTPAAPGSQVFGGSDEGGDMPCP